jgi:porin
MFTKWIPLSLCLWVSAGLLSLVMTNPTLCDAAEFIGHEHHHHPALRQFWRGVKEVAEEEESWLRQRHMTGDWAELRGKLAAWGVTPSLTYVSNLLANPVGGQRRRFAYDHSLGLDLALDLEKLTGLTDLTFHVSGVSRSGSNLSATAIGNTFTVSSLSGSETIRLYALTLERELFSGKLRVLLGRFGVGDEFATSPLYNVFVNTALDGNPISLPLNLPSFASSSYPIAQWGLRVAASPTPEWHMMTAVTNGDRTLQRNRTHGVDFSFRRNADIFVIGEVGYLHNQRADSTGLPGNVKFGGYYDAGSFLDLYRDKRGGASIVSGLPQQRHHGNYGFYLLIDQQMYRETDPKHNQGLTPFAGLTVAPSAINPLPLFVMAGVVYNGLFPGRDRDSAGLSVAYGGFSSALRRAQRAAHRLIGTAVPIQYFEMALELTYEYEVAPHFILQPDVQYILRPGGAGNIPDALVLGMQVAINF